MHIDSGASHTILAPDQLARFPRSTWQFDTSTEVSLSQADGSHVHVDGMIKMTVKVGKTTRHLSIVIADVTSGCILGRDFLMSTGAILDFDNKRLLINGEIIPCFTLNNQKESSASAFKCYRLQVQETTKIPAGHEVIIRPSSEETSYPALGLVQPSSCLPKNGVMVARSVVDGDNVCVRLCNVSDHEQSVKEGTVVATMTPLEADEIIECNPETQESISTGAPDHVQEMLADALQDVPVNHQPIVTNLIRKYSTVFSTGETDIGRTSLVKHSIETGDARPIKQRPRRAPREQQEEIDRQVKVLLDDGLIEPTQSPWSTPVVLVKKKNGTWRLCCDYRRLNDVTVKDAFPLPRIDDTLDSLSGAKWFCTLDLAAGYWQVELDEEAKQKSAFVVQGGLYSWNVMPFGLTNAPSTFERLMERVLDGLHWKTLLVYLDDIIVYGSSISETACRLEEVFLRLQSAGLKLKPSKCSLFKTSVNYLGHVVSADGIHTDPEKIKAVKDWAIPTTVKQVRSFLGLASYYRRFIPQFAHIARPLHHLTGKNVKFEWTAACQEAFEELKSRLVSSPILAYPRDEGQYVLDTDASAYAMGAVLSQVQDGTEHVIAYASKTFSKEQRNYCVTRKELQSVVFFLRYFRHYLYGRHVIVRTDHAALKWLYNFKDAEGQIARWLQILSNFDVQIEHRPGVRHQNADALSRPPCKQCDREACVNFIRYPVCCSLPKPVKVYSVKVTKKQVPSPCSPSQSAEVFKVSVTVKKNPSPEETNQCAQQEATEYVPDENIPDQTVAHQIHGEVHELTPLITLKDIREEQLKDPTMNLIMTTLESGEARPEWKTVAPRAPDLKAYWSQWNLLCINDGILCRKWVSNDGKSFTRKIILPHSMRETCFQELHGSKAGGHLGYTKTLHRLRDRYYWIGITADVRSYLRKCTSCARRKKPTKTRRAKLRQYTVGAPLERVALDILGPLPETEKGNIYVLVIADYFTKWVEILPLPDQTAETVAKAFTEEFVCRFGAPHEVHSDQGRNFESRVFAETLRLLGSSKTRTTPYNPKSDGMVERFNRTLLNMVSQMLDPLKHQRDWDDQLPYVGLAYRSAVHESTGETPNMLMMGHEITLPLDLMVESLPDDEEDDNDLLTDFALDLRERMKAAHEQARDVLQTSAGRQKRNYDRRAHGNGIAEGSFVWLFSRARKPGITNKLRLPWEGPYLVVQKLSDVHVRIQKSPRAKSMVIHVDRLKPYTGPELVPWKYRKELMVDRDQQESIVSHRMTPTPPHNTPSQPAATENSEQQTGTMGTTDDMPSTSSVPADPKVRRPEAHDTPSSQDPEPVNDSSNQSAGIMLNGAPNSAQPSDDQQSGEKSSVLSSPVPVSGAPSGGKTSNETVSDSTRNKLAEVEDSKQTVEKETTKSKNGDQPRRNPSRKRQLPARYRLNQITCMPQPKTSFSSHMALQYRQSEELPVTCEPGYYMV